MKTFIALVSSFIALVARLLFSSVLIWQGWNAWAPKVLGVAPLTVWDGLCLSVCIFGLAEAWKTGASYRKPPGGGCCGGRQ